MEETNTEQKETKQISRENTIGFLSGIPEYKVVYDHLDYYGEPFVKTSLNNLDMGPILRNGVIQLAYSQYKLDQTMVQCSFQMYCDKVGLPCKASNISEAVVESYREAAMQLERVAYFLESKLK